MLSRGCAIFLGGESRGLAQVGPGRAFRLVNGRPSAVDILNHSATPFAWAAP